MASIRDTNTSYEIYMADYNSEEVLNGLAINATITLENDMCNEHSKELHGFNFDSLKHLIKESSVENIVLQCQNCGELCDLQLNRKSKNNSDSIILYTYKLNGRVLQFYSICKCKYYDILLRTSSESKEIKSSEVQIIPVRIKARFREVAFAMKYFSVSHNASDTLPLFI